VQVTQLFPAQLTYKMAVKVVVAKVVTVAQ
jgi:hypothetical protein